MFREFDRLESLLSVWKDGSDVVRMNKNAGITPVPVSQDTLDVLREAAEASVLTRGKFDITFGALTDIWRFDHDQDNVVPDRQLIEARLPRIDYRAVQVDGTARTAFITRPGMRVHLGGIGKGYAVDRAVALLKERGFTRFPDPVRRRSLRGRHQRRHSRGSWASPIRAARTSRSPRCRSATARSAPQATTSASS